MGTELGILVDYFVRSSFVLTLAVGLQLASANSERLVLCMGVVVGLVVFTPPYFLNISGLEATFISGVIIALFLSLALSLLIVYIRRLSNSIVISITLVAQITIWYFMMSEENPLTGAGGLVEFPGIEMLQEANIYYTIPFVAYALSIISVMVFEKYSMLRNTEVLVRDKNLAMSLGIPSTRIYLTSVGVMASFLLLSSIIWVAMEGKYGPRSFSVNMALLPVIPVLMSARPPFRYIKIVIFPFIYFLSMYVTVRFLEMEDLVVERILIGLALCAYAYRHKIPFLRKFFYR